MFSFDYTFVLNILASAVIVVIAYLNRKHPMVMHMEQEAQGM